MIFINFKTYQEGVGEQALKLAGLVQKVAQETGVEILSLPSATDLFQLSQRGFSVWAQHVDGMVLGPGTGQLPPRVVLLAGAQGTLVSHSEHKLPSEIIGETVKECREIGLRTLVCVESLAEARRVVDFEPDFIAYEPVELIGSQNESVSTTQPEVIKTFTEEFQKVPVLVGAGIHSAKDVKLALELGAKGVLVSSAVVLAADPEKKLLELARAFGD